MCNHVVKLFTRKRNHYIQKGIQKLLILKSYILILNEFWFCYDCYVDLPTYSYVLGVIANV